MMKRGEGKDVSDEFTDEDTPLVKQLRDQLKEANKSLKGFEAEITEFRTAKRTATLSELLESKGLPPKIAKLIPADVEPDKFDEWFSDYADAFGFKPVPAEEQPDAEQLARQRLATVEVSGTPQAADIASAIQNAKSADDIIALINSGRKF